MSGPQTVETCRCGTPVVRDRDAVFEPTMTSAGAETPYYEHTELRCRVYRAANGEGRR